MKNRPLAVGSVIEGYWLADVLACGGFSFVYRAYDEEDTPYAVKEYMPATLALRTGDDPAVVLPPEHVTTFRYGLRCFFEEARTLAALQHPNVVRVANFFRANGTAYMVMDPLRGASLQEQLAGGEAPGELWMRAAFGQLLEGLREVHSRKLLHLDIKPANIFIGETGVPVLIDFGAARRMRGAGGFALPPVFTPGFASPEHYRQRDKAGPWSDIYSIGASMYACLPGSVLPPAPERLERDRLIGARTGWVGKYSVELLDIIDWCLRLKPIERPQSVFALQKALLGRRRAECDGALAA